MKRIVLCLDGSLESEKAARFLARIAHDEPYELVVLSVLPKPNSSEGACSDLKRQHAYFQDSFKDVQQFFDGANVQVRHLVRYGRPGKRIVSVAKALQAELIVLGAVGHSMVARMLLGSTSDYVATNAHCSVAVIRSNEATAKDTDKRKLNIALAYEQSGPARAAFEEITEFRWGDGTLFDLMTVVPDHVEFTDDGDAILRKRRERAQTCLTELQNELSPSAPVNSGYLLESNHVGEAIVHFSENHGTDLLVVGETRQSTASRLLLGSVSRFVLRHAPCSVWITRNRTIEGIRKTPRRRKIAQPVDIPSMG